MYADRRPGNLCLALKRQQAGVTYVTYRPANLQRNKYLVFLQHSGFNLRVIHQHSVNADFGFGGISYVNHLPRHLFCTTKFNFPEYYLSPHTDIIPIKTTSFLKQRANSSDRPMRALRPIGTAPVPGEEPRLGDNLVEEV